MKLRILAVTVLAPLLFVACRTTRASGAVRHEDEAAIRALDASFSELTVRGEYRALVESYYTADARFMAPNVRGVVGPSAIEAMLRAWPPVTAMVLNTEDVVVRGDLGYSCGTYSMTMTPPGAAPIKDEGKFLEIFRRQSDGSWKVTRDIFNSDLAAAGSEATK